jgi:DNA recombination protein RmuC
MIIEILLGTIIVLNIILIMVHLTSKRDKKDLERQENIYRNFENKMLDEFSRNRLEVNHSFSKLREELQKTTTTFSDSISKRITDLAGLQNTQFENIRKTVEVRLRFLQEDNSKKLEEMRKTVDDKLHSALEKRLGEAFKQVSERLEKVHEGLGEMKKLSTGVGDLKKVLTNVKSRGIMGEVQLEAQLTQLLSPQQYEKNVKTKPGSDAFVEFALKLPGKDEIEKPVWIPVDAKFPLEKYENLLFAYDKGDKELVTRVSKEFVADIKNFAKEIRDKYLDPPHTTDFGLMYLPVEALYAEVLRFRGLFEVLQREYRIVPVGPTTLAAILNSLQMGFKTLAIEKRSSEVWKLLGVVKTQFGKFGDLLDKTQKKLNEASKSIEDATKKSRYIEGRLSKVENLPSTEETPHLPVD